MFTTTVPRVAPRLGTAVQCEARPAAQRCANLSSRTWQPAQQQLGRRFRSTFREQFGEQYRKSPVLFPFAVTV
jgi:hypothetical protein